MTKKAETCFIVSTNATAATQNRLLTNGKEVRLHLRVTVFANKSPCIVVDCVGRDVVF